MTVSISSAVHIYSALSLSLSLSLSFTLLSILSLNGYIVVSLQLLNLFLGSVQVCLELSTCNG